VEELEEIASDLLATANEFLLPGLRVQVEKFVIDILEKKNFHEIWKVACDVSSSSLKALCFEKIIYNYAIWEDLLTPEIYGELKEYMNKK
jgi:hypothetical protein